MLQISREQRTKLGKLKEKASKLQKQLDEICKEAEFITKDESDLTFDWIYNDFIDLEKLLINLDITVG